MSQTTKTALKELQRLDGEIQEAEKRADAVGPQLEDVEGPALQTRYRVRRYQGALTGDEAR